MINQMNKILILVGALLFFCIPNTNAQSKFGEDENACKENLSIFREFYKQKNYADALNPWRWTFINCPASSGNIYKNGPKIIKAKLKSEKENKDAYVDTLMLIFDQRIKYGFGEKGYVLGLKGYELVITDKNRSAEAYDILDQAIKLTGNKSDFRAVYGFMKSVVNLEKSGQKTKEDVLNTYNIVASIIDYNIINESKYTKYFVQYSEKIEALYTPYANCQDLVLLFGNKFNQNKDKISFLKRVVKNLKSLKCYENDLYLKVLESLKLIQPNFETERDIFDYYFVNKKYLQAYNIISNCLDSYANDMSNEELIKLKMDIANTARLCGKYVSAINLVNEVISENDKFGEAYMLKGNIYVSGASACGSDFENKTVYWLAVDIFKKALKFKDTKLKASKSINTYSKYFPDKETCFFNGLESGQSYNIGCWINKSTIVRTID